jgi:hypothetical protein
VKAYGFAQSLSIGSAAAACHNIVSINPEAGGGGAAGGQGQASKFCTYKDMRNPWLRTGAAVGVLAESYF